MNTETDYYAVLGVMPDAESVVIVAAYRALASLYHPDRWKGDVEAATRRMSEINVAYGVLSDAAKRKAYDATRTSSHSSFAAGDDDSDKAFDEALTEQEARWSIALEIFPDLADIRKRLSKTAHRLAFAFVTVMLETKRFNERKDISLELENSFLHQYFGTNPEIVAFVKQLIAAGRRDAVKAVNRYIEVLGSDIPAKLIVDKVYPDVGSLGALAHFVTKAEDPDSEDAFQAAWTLALRLKYVPKMSDVQPRFKLHLNLEEVASFASKKEFVQWVLVHLT